MKIVHVFLAFCLGLVFLSCNSVSLVRESPGGKVTGTSAPNTLLAASPTPLPAGTTDTSLPQVLIPGPRPPQSGDLIQPSDLVYLGAFRLPDGPPEIGWEYSGEAMTYYPYGDPNGSDDGFPGSIFGVGNPWNTYVSEIGLPMPIISSAKNVDDLNTAVTLQDFHDIRGGLFGPLEIPRVGLEYLPAQDGQTSDKLYFSLAQHMGEGETNPTHGWSDLNLANPHTVGTWRIGEYWNYVTADYLFAIPSAWADIHTPGMYLATGRFRDGGQGARGPSLFAIGPWNQGNPPASGATLPANPLLLYTDVTTEDNFTLDGYHHSDEWAGGAWLTAGEKSALIFVGTKGRGNCWYGCSDGTVWPDQPPYPESCPDFDRGWWSTSFEGLILFYDPADLAAVTRGEKQTWEPQPYATMGIDNYLFNIHSSQQKHHLGDVSYDRQHGLLYIFELMADGAKPLVHVWRII